MDIRKAIEERHSVRSYLDTPIEGEVLARLEEAIEEANREGELHIQLIRDEPGAFSGLLAHYGKFSGVRNYLAVVGKRADDLDVRAGYWGEKVVLTAQDAGLNTCWVGGTFNRFRVRYEVGPGEKLVCVIAIGYGAEQGRPHRSKSTESCCDFAESGTVPEWFAEGMSAAMLAPTAMNQQRFKFRLFEDHTIVGSTAPGPFTAVDLGIATFHFEAASGHRVSLT